MNEDEKAMLWTMALIEDLIDDGIMEGPKRITPEGWKLHDELIDDGYEPTGEQIAKCMNELKVEPFVDEEYEKAIIASN